MNNFIANSIFLVRPSNCCFNVETAFSNGFQHDSSIWSANELKQTISNEFEQVVESLKENNIPVIVFNDTQEPPKPDAIFPNNWISTHANGNIILYPMLAKNRRIERREDIVDFFLKNYQSNKVLNYSTREDKNEFLEGTGSIVFDHGNQLAYACASPRTNKNLFYTLCESLNYEPVFFNALDVKNQPIYHTNVMMNINEHFVVICLDSITNFDEKTKVIESFKKTNKKIIAISIEQMNAFAGNMLLIQNSSYKKFLALSTSAFDVLYTHQKLQIEKFCTLLPFNIKTIENIGGGSIRCMMGEIFLTPLN